jgi:hypothetical protein
VSELAKDVRSAISSREPMNWPEFREAIHDAYGLAKSTDERVELLQLYKQLMDYVAGTQIAPSDLPQFNETRTKDYRLLLVQEGRVGDNACVETLDEITRREIAAGRMAPDDELRQITVQGLAAPHLSRAQLETIAANSGKSFLARLFGR